MATSTRKRRSSSKVNKVLTGKFPPNKEISEARKLVADGKSPAQVAKAMDISGNHALFLTRLAAIKPADRLEQLDAETVVRLRDEEGLPWHTIGARAGIVALAGVKYLYKAGGGSGNAKGRVAKADSNGSEAKPKRSRSKGRRATARRGSARRKREEAADPSPSA